MKAEALPEATIKYLHKLHTPRRMCNVKVKKKIINTRKDDTSNPQSYVINTKE
jgi:hypothetical protein